MPKFTPDGYCIYCQNPSDSDEHVIPYGLNGSYVLKSASCTGCRDITSKFERALLRGSFAQLRLGHQFKTRRPKKRPTSFPLLVNKYGRESQVNASPYIHPLAMTLPLFPKPKLLFGDANYAQLRPNGVVVFHLNSIDAVLSAHNADTVAIVQEIQYLDLARLLAKSAYGFLIGELGRSRVRGNYLLPIVFGDMSLAGLYIGSSDRVLTADASDPALSYQSYRLPSTLGGGEIAVVIMRLFPHMRDNPAYIVVCDLNEGCEDAV